MLKDSEKRFRTIFEGAADNILGADMENQKFVFVNKFNV